MTENLEHLLNLEIAAVDRRDLVLPCQQVQVRRKVLEERRQLESLAQMLLTNLVLSHARSDTRHKHFRLDSMTTNDGDGNALALFENGREQIARLDGLPAAAAGLMKCKFQHELCRWCHAKVANRGLAERVEVALERVHDLVRVQVELGHDLREGVPLDLCERQEDVLIRHLRVVAAP